MSNIYKLQSEIAREQFTNDLLKKAVEYETIKPLIAEIISAAELVSAHTDRCDWTDDCGCVNQELHRAIDAYEQAIKKE